MSLSISLLTLSGTIPVALDNKKKDYLRIGKMLNCVVAYLGAISCTRSSLVTLSYPLSLTVSRTCSLTCSRHPASSRSWFSLWRSLSSYEHCGKWSYLVASQSIPYLSLSPDSTMALLSESSASPSPICCRLRPRAIVLELPVMGFLTEASNIHDEEELVTNVQLRMKKKINM